MDVDEVKLAKGKMEVDLIIIFKKFEQATGFKVRSVNIIRSNDLGPLTDLQTVKITASIILDD